MHARSSTSVVTFLLLSFSLAFTSGCGSSGSDDSGPARVPSFKGAPASFNGQFKGKGRAFTPYWSEESLSFTVAIEKTPAQLDLYYDVRQANGRTFTLGKLVGHRIRGNQIYTEDLKTVVGEIGATGFHVTRSGDGQAIIARREDGSLSFSGYVEYGPTKISFSAILTK